MKAYLAFKFAQIIRLCLDKNLSFHMSAESNHLDVFKLNSDGTADFSFNSWYAGPLKGLESGNTIKLDDLIKKIEDYGN
jgi:hypothetical protein